jgi:cytidylate kinase
LPTSSPATNPTSPGAGATTGLHRVLAALAPAERWVILVDGGSGSGKTTLAAQLAVALDAQLVRLDDFYPGWDGLEAASVAVLTDVLGAHRWRRWDWEAQAPAEWHAVDPNQPIVIEGSGALSRANRAHATLGVWINLDAEERKRRAMIRDGDTYRPHWDRWAAQEARFFARERPDVLADVVIDESYFAI